MGATKYRKKKCGSNQVSLSMGFFYKRDLNLFDEVFSNHHMLLQLATNSPTYLVLNLYQILEQSCMSSSVDKAYKMNLPWN